MDGFIAPFAFWVVECAENGISQGICINFRESVSQETKDTDLAVSLMAILIASKKLAGKFGGVDTFIGEAVSQGSETLVIDENLCAIASVVTGAGYYRAM